MSGLLERVVGDWLTNADERGYQYAFASLLGREGHTVKYVSPHSHLEHGKDIISSKGQRIFTYQLKAGNISQAAWRDMRHEVEEAATVPIEVPGLPKRVANRAYLVLTGRVSDSVRNQISLINEDMRQRRYAQIEVVEKYELITRFANAFETFFPESIGPPTQLLTLYSRSGRGPQDNETLFSLLESIGTMGTTRTKLVRALSNIVVVAQIAASPYRREDNHIGQIETWTMAACSVLRTARRNKLQKADWSSPFSLCLQSIREAGDMLLDEAFSREDFLEGRALSEAILLPYRRTVTLGYVAAVVNMKAISGGDVREDCKRLYTLAQRERPFGFWGESAWNFVLNLAVALRYIPQHSLFGEAMMDEWLKVACPIRPPSPKDPYHSIEDFLESLVVQDSEDDNGWNPLSYTAEAAIDFLARRLRRQTLNRVWARVSKTRQATFVPQRLDDLLVPNCEKGTLEIRNLPLEGSWRQLQKEAFGKRCSLFSKEAAVLLPIFLCVFGHRVSPSLAGELDFQTSSLQFQKEWS